MNLTFHYTNAPAAQAPAAAPAAVDAAAPLAPLTPDASGATGAGQAAAAGVQQAAAQPAMAFAQWLGLEAVAPALPPDAAGAPAPALDGTVPGPEAAVEEQQANADAPLLGAMAMDMPPLPLMPSTQAMLAAVVAALPGVPGTREPAPAADTDPAPLPGAPVARRVDAALPLADSAPRPVSGAVPNAGAVPNGGTAPNAGAAPAALPAETLASSGAASQDQLAPSVERGAANTAGIAAPAPGNVQRPADSVTLSGPPTAWRQTLQEALGDRLQLQLGKNAELAVIRLEPPMLGRVEIAIRHSAGSLEVHISATHGEVLRQLQAVGENLRNDLAQRQFTDVAVNIAQAPRAAAAGNMPMFAGDGSGRGRQHEGQEEQQPGNALDEANTGAAPFSLNVPGNRRA
jgi:flagellar hook-length control protein FliK